MPGDRGVGGQREVDRRLGAPHQPDLVDGLLHRPPGRVVVLEELRGADGHVRVLALDPRRSRSPARNSGMSATAATQRRHPRRASRSAARRRRPATPRRCTATTARTKAAEQHDRQRDGERDVERSPGPSARARTRTRRPAGPTAARSSRSPAGSARRTSPNPQSPKSSDTGEPGLDEVRHGAAADDTGPPRELDRGDAGERREARASLSRALRGARAPEPSPG